MQEGDESDSPSPCGRGLGGGVETKPLFGLARAMRRRPTRAERVLWYRLRNSQLEGRKFRRQVPTGCYIADFFCPAARLVVEVDGITHASRASDAERDSWMQSQGLRVIRVLHDDVIANVEGVLAVIDMAASEPLPLAPSRKGRDRNSAA